MSNRKQVPGKFVWFEHVSTDAKKAQAFYGEVLGWTVRAYPLGAGSYDMIYTGDTMIGGYATPVKRESSHWLSCVSVEDVDATAKAVLAHGGEIVVAPADIPGVGRRAHCLDPQGALFCLFKSATGDAPDVTQAPHGGWVWNELHTPEPAKAIAFYEQVLGFSCKTMDMGPGGKYFIVSKDGLDRGGVMLDPCPGGPARWLPYVSVDDPDAALARASKVGGKILHGPEDIPGVGRFGTVEDPTGALFAVIKPNPRSSTPAP